MNLWVKSNAKDEETGEELRVHLAAGAGKTAELNRKLACVQLGGNLTGSAEFLHKEAEKRAHRPHLRCRIQKQNRLRSVRRFICSPVRRTRFCG